MDVDFAALARALERPMGDPVREKAEWLIARAASLWHEPVYRITPTGLELVETEWSMPWVERQLEAARARLLLGAESPTLDADGAVPAAPCGAPRDHRRPRGDLRGGG